MIKKLLKDRARNLQIAANFCWSRLKMHKLLPFFKRWRWTGRGRGQVAISGRHMTCRRILSKMGHGTKEKIKRLRDIWDYQRDGWFHADGWSNSSLMCGRGTSPTSKVYVVSFPNPLDIQIHVSSPTSKVSAPYFDTRTIITRYVTGVCGKSSHTPSFGS